MPFLRLRVSLALFALLPCVGTAFGAHPKVIQGPVPTWVKPATAPISDVQTDAGHNVTTLLMERQVNAETAECYYHWAYRINTASGVQTASQIDAEFDPSYQSLTFHSITVHRGGTPTDQLNIDKLQVLQQEKDLERFQYNGQLTALTMLEDVRVGDVIEYAFTRHGRNPVFGEHFDDISALSWTNPIRNLRLRVLAVRSRDLVIHNLGETPVEHSEQELEPNLVEHLWSGQNLEAAVCEQGAPAWHLFVPVLQITDFQFWSDVVNWALPFYQVTIPDRAVSEKAKEITRDITDPHQKALALLDFVQGEIRYLGIEIGPQSHAPQEPSRVLERRYGDCKDKSRLLCAMLDAVNIKAVPAFTHSTRSWTNDRWLPSPCNFDHVITRITISGSDYWVDPTLSDQQGTLMARSIPAYVLALPIAPGVKDLARIQPRPESLNSLQVLEEYDVPELKNPAFLTVTSTYRGALADAMRRYLRDTPAETIAKNALNTTLQKRHDAIPTGAPEWKDDTRSNKISITSRYRLPGFWDTTEKSPEITAAFYPWELRDYVQEPEHSVRTAPYVLPYPFGLAHRTTVKLPVDWAAANEHQSFQDPAFEASISATNSGRELSLSYRYTTLDDHVDPSRMPEYAQRLRKFREQLGYSMSYNTAIAARNATYRLNWVLLGVFAGAAVVWVLGGIWLHRRNWSVASPPAIINPMLHGLGGWLILVGFGVMLRPIIQTVTIIGAATPLFDARTWDASNGWTQLVISLEFFFQMGLLALEVVSIFSFLTKRRTFPVLFIAVFGAAALFTVLDAIAMIMLGQDLSAMVGRATVELGKLILPALIWIPYIIVSKRVRTTFTVDWRPKAGAASTAAVSQAEVVA